MESEFLKNAVKDFKFFINYIFPQSFKTSVPAPHLLIWGDRIQNNRMTATLSARKHLKSTLMYAYLMWRLFKLNDSEDWLYMSYTEPLSRYHTANIKRLIRNNPFFQNFKDLSNAESTIKYTLNDREIFSVNPASIMRFNRGWHGHGVVCDDILADPTNELNLTIIQTITNTFFEEVLSLPIEGGELHLVGTAQHSEDLFFQIKNRSNAFNWAMYPAIVNELDKTVLWKELFSIERLHQIRDEEIGEKAFNKEYMCSPVWSEDAYFKREQILNIIDKKLVNIRHIPLGSGEVIAGYDIGKMRHPSHFTVFLHEKGLIYQVYQIFMDNWDYTKQVDLINGLIKELNIYRVYYDDTRQELESFFEQGILPRGLWQSVKFSMPIKFQLAANFAKAVEKGNIRLQNDSRMIKSILSVNNNLEALETVEGHADAFWSIALALSHRQSARISVAGAGRYR